MRFFAMFVSVFVATPVLADAVVATRTIRAHSVLTAQDLAIKPIAMNGTFDDPSLLIGMETRTALYAGRPILEGDIGPPAIVDRNQIVTLLYRQGGLTITAEARSLGRGGIGDTLRVLNMSSRMTVEGRIQVDGSVLVN
ncbi:MAG: flagellar basal body P-ring formation protein FlgA [Rhodobacterales bacterium]|jgi:flagella basal body P-ring formation protein FlgA|nr:flagellar basal body P-ring formation protein FlgA [Rhodobacterales bacterium]MDX5389694.1 flagellar basal body P-ring formation protein FlgA [Rhodobacterales bacterium]MDX5489391.1 flagellar basal body P-ring formation protein FlgA [Rhodobacterales bacterium]